MFREFIVTLCARDLHHDVVGAVSTKSLAIKAIAEKRPELVILEAGLPDGSGFELMEEQRRRSPHAPKYLLLAARCDALTVAQASRSPATGFVDKHTASVGTFTAALRALERGQPYYSSGYNDAALRLVLDPQSPLRRLTAREVDVLAFIGEAFDDAEIGAQLGISRHTAKTHRMNIRRKLGLASTPKLIAFAQKHGFVRPPRS